MNKEYPKQFHDILNELVEFFQTPINDFTLKPLSNRYLHSLNFVLELDDKNYLLRVMPSKQSNQSKKNECALTTEMGKLKLGPEVLYRDEDNHYMLIEYIEGNTLSIDTLPNHLSAVIEQLKKLHASKNYDAAPIRPSLDRVERHLKIAKIPSVDEYFNEKKIFDTIINLENQLNTPEKKCLIHHDLNLSNIIITPENRIYFIDWTDAGIGSLYFDLANLALFLPDDKHYDLIKLYFNDGNEAEHSVILKKHIRFRILFLAAWCIQNSSQYDVKSKINFKEHMNRKHTLNSNDLIKGFITHTYMPKSPDEWLSTAAIFLKSFLERKLR